RVWWAKFVIPSNLILSAGNIVTGFSTTNRIPPPITKNKSLSTIYAVADGIPVAVNLRQPKKTTCT
ncbi:MAG: hypothetical protein PVH63_04190, partial [Balneolaceae bacterium]